jgi:hypothetical protein
LRPFVAFLVLLGLGAIALPETHAQGVPVIDSAVLSQATQTASNTANIMNTNQQILTTVNQTLQAITGNRDTSTLNSAALGSGFDLGGAPNFSSLLSGGGMQWGNLGAYGSTAADIINGLNLVKSLSGDGNAVVVAGYDKAYLGSVNTTSAVMGMISASQQSAQSRTQNFQSAAAMIGTAPDVKGSIDQNSQLQVQTGLTVNELIGVMNANNASLNAQQQQDLASQAESAKIMQFTPYNGSGTSQTTNGVQ